MISASPRRLGVFKSVVDQGGFNAAANHLGIAQPSVGAHVKALENQIGQPLFYRHRGSRPKLTKAGETLYAFAVDFLRKADETTSTLADLRRAATQEIAIAVHRDVAAYALPIRLASFAHDNKNIRVVTRIGTIEDVIDMVQGHDVLLGLLLSSGPTSTLTSEVLAREPIMLVAARGHPLAGRRSVAPSDLDDVELVTGLRQSRYAKIVDAALRKAGVAHYRIVMELQESPAVKEMVRHGAGIACLPHCTVRDELDAGTLVALPLTIPLADLELRCAYQTPLSDTGKRLMNHLRDAVTR